MPIHPDDKARYPKNWKQISDSIRFDRAGGMCECEGECGVNHWGGLGAHGIRCNERHAHEAVWFKGVVILTVAHLDHTPENCEPENLRAMCQRCHLRFDADHHKRTRARRRREALEEAGQTKLFQGGE